MEQSTPNHFEHVGVTGTIRLEIHRDGQPVETIEEKNLVVNNGKTNLCRLLGDSSSSTREITEVGFGIGVAAASVTDVGLTSAVMKSVTTTYPTATTVQFDFVLEKAEGNGLAITEFGLFHQNGNMFSRRVRSAINKASDMRIVGSWTISF